MTTDQMKAAAQQVLEENILKFWMEKMYDPKGGFYGRMDGKGVLHPEAERGAVLNARLLWSFSAAYRVLHKPEYLRMAEHELAYLLEHFIDKEHGGVYWSVTAEGKPLDTHKQIYAQAFMLYALSEYHRATEDAQALQLAIEFFRLIEEHGRDRVDGGYIEATTHNWQPIDDMRLSDKDENTVKSQNTNLHVLEAYTNLYRIWPSDELREAQNALIDCFEQRIILPTGHLGLFFDMQWHATNNHFSAGHDIECSWLMDEAAEVVGRNCDHTVHRLAAAASEDLHGDGSLGELDWWTQAETVVGFINLYKHFGDDKAWEQAERTWQFINTRLVDHEHGEWFWAILPDCTPDTANDKAGFWKCPYHNSRMCLELIERLQ